MRDRRPFLFCMLVLAALLIADVWLIVARGSNVPSWDDWDNVPVLTGHQPVTMQWIWSQHNEHRDPLPRIIIVALNRFIALDFRTAMYFDVLAAAGVALALMLSLRLARGRSSYLDAFIPIVLLHWGQSENLLWGWQVQFYASALLAGVILAMIARIRSPHDRRLLLGAAICIPMLALCGANGLVLIPPLAIWLGYAAIAQLHSQTSSRVAILLAAACAVSTSALGLYFVDYHAVPYHPASHSLSTMLATASKFLTMGLGPGIVGLNAVRAPMRFWQLVCLATTLLFGLTILLLLWTWLTNRAERLRAAGLLMFLGSMSAIALALGMGREGFEPRYVILSVPAMCAIYIAWSIYGSIRLRTIIPAALGVFALAAFVPNTIFGVRYAHYLRSNLVAFENEMIAGVPLYRLIHNHNEYLHPHDQVLMDYMPMLRDAKVGAFVHLRDNPPFKEIHLPLTPVKTYDMDWHADTATAVATGLYPFIELELPDEIEVAGIRVRYSFTSDTAIAPYFMIFWKTSEQTDFPKTSYKKFTPTGDYANWRRGTWTRMNDALTTMDVWPCDRIKTLRICMFSTLGTTKFYEVTLLVPEKPESEKSDAGITQTSSHPATRPAERR